jgi:hypothetical protein
MYVQVLSIRHIYFASELALVALKKSMQIHPYYISQLLLIYELFFRADAVG